MKPDLIYTKSCWYTSASLKRLERHFNIHMVTSKAELVDKLPLAQVLVASLEYDYPVEQFRMAHKLKFIITNTTGINHIHIPEGSDMKLIYLEDRSLIQNITTTAELALTLILSALRNLGENLRSVQNGIWNRYRSPGQSWEGKNVGIVGLGRLGRLVASYCQKLGMNITYYDPYVSDTDYKKVETLVDIVTQADIVSIHATLTPETTGMFDYSIFSHFKNGAILINTARGEVINEADLIQALDEGIISSVGLDVICDEQAESLFDSSPILKYSMEHPNVLITPHIGGACEESRRVTEQIVIEDLLRHYEKS